ncbi:MAG: hypothetical protein Fur0025_22570 [Oscillatoriaceae cyanobacterium]
MAGGESQTNASLSERELQVIELVAAGLTNQEISEHLEISKRTVDNHISNILNKTRTSNRVALVRWALQSGKVCINDVNCCILPTPNTNEENEVSLTDDLSDGSNGAAESWVAHGANQAIEPLEAASSEPYPKAQQI